MSGGGIYGEVGWGLVGRGLVAFVFDGRRIVYILIYYGYLSFI
jgi:hypothetical protein